MKFLIASVLLATLLVPGFAKSATVPTKNTLKLELQCELTRRYLDAKGNVQSEQLTPKTLKPKPLLIVDTSTRGSVPPTEMKFSVSSPDGTIEVVALAMVLDTFGKDLVMTLSHSIELVDLKVSVSEPTVFARPISYTDADLSHKSTLQFATGRTPEGFVVNQYFSRCTIAPIP